MTPLGEYKFKFADGWDAYFRNLDKSVRDRILAKMEQLRHEHSSRHLKQAPIFVEEVGQYRICFKIDEKERMKIFYFVGDHKDYEKWYSGVKQG